MKKIISIVLTICMLFSMISVVSADNLSEAERLALLSEKEFTYIDINPNIDAFASAEVIRDYSVFATVESADASSDFNALHTMDGYSYRTRIPNKTHGGVAIDGTESFYYKGIGYFPIDSLRIYSTQGHTPLLYITDSFKLSAEELKAAKFNYYKNIQKSTTAKMVAAEPDKYTTATFALPTNDNDFAYMPEVDKIETKGSNYNVYLKDSDTGLKFRIGPMNDKEYVKNAVDFVNGGSHSVTLPSGVKGDQISVAMVTASVNDGGTVSAFKILPAAALMPLEVKYADGTTDVNYVVVRSNASVNDTVGCSIVYGNKYNGSTEINYAADSSALASLAFLKDSGLTMEDVTFPSNVSGGEMNFATALRANQHDTYTNFANKISVGTFDIKDEEITSIRFVNDQAPGDNNIEGIISFDRDNGAAKDVRALIPVTVKNGDPDKAYFLYAGRITQQPAVFAATVTGKSLQEKIDAVNAKLELVNDSTTEADCEIIDKEIAALKTESELVKDSDFNQEKYALIKNKLLELAQRKIKAVEAAIEGLDDAYTYSMKEAVVAVYADYNFLISNGIAESEINAELRNKIKALYASYEKATALEALASAWDVYSYDMYNEIVKANEDLVSMETMVSAKAVEAIKKYYEIAVAAKAIDDKIDALSYAYETSMLEEVLAIEAEVNKFVANGGSEEAFENIVKLKSLVESAATDILNTDIAAVEEKIAQLSDAYSVTEKDAIEKIIADIASIESRGGKVSSAAEAKFNKILAQKNEAALYVTNELTYTRDVFEDVKEYAGQGYADAEKGVYVYPSNAWSPVVSAIAGSNRMAIDEAGFISQLNVNDKNVGTANGIPYQFGPIKSAVHGVSNKPNSINAADCSNVIDINVEELPYEELYLVAWAKVNNTSASIVYTYADGSTSTEQNVTAIKGGYESKQKVDEYTELLHGSGILYWRAYNSTAAYDQKVGYGGYSIYVTAHRLTPDDTKELKSVKITVSDKDVNVFALTGKVSNSGILSGNLDKTMEAFANASTADEIRKLVKTSGKYMELLDEKGVEYNSTYAATVEQYKEEYIAVESVECYTDVDNRNITVTFTGAIAEDSITKQNFVLKKDGVVVSDYTITKVSDKVVKITVKNSFDYDSAYTLEISEKISNDEKTVTLGETIVYDYDGLAAVDVEITYENNKVKIYLKNNLNEKLENVVVMTGAFDKDNALIKFEPVTASIEAGAEFNQTIDFNVAAEKITCEVIDTLDNAKFLFKHISVK